MAEEERTESEEEPKPEISRRVRYLNGNIPVSYAMLGPSMIYTAMLPPYLAIEPRVGDLVEATDGTIFEIKSLVHTIVNGSAGLRVEIGKNTGGISPSPDGGSVDEVDI